MVDKRGQPGHNGHRIDKLRHPPTAESYSWWSDDLGFEDDVIDAAEDEADSRRERMDLGSGCFQRRRQPGAE